MSDIIANIQELKQNLENMSKQIEKISFTETNNLMLLPVSHVPEDKKATHINVCLQLEYNEGKQNIILPNVLFPVDLFDGKPFHVTTQEKLNSVKKRVNSIVRILIEKNSFTDEQIDALYKEYDDKSEITYDIAKIIAFVKTLNIEDFDETKNTKLFYAGIKPRNSNTSIFTPYFVSNIKTALTNISGDKYANMFVSLE